MKRHMTWSMPGGLAGYWRSVGTRRFFQDLGNFPTALGLILKRDRAAARVHLLWGAAVSLVVATLISHWVGLFLAAGLMSSLPSILGRLVSALVFRLWSDLVQYLTPFRNRRPTGLSGVMVGMLGAALALGAGFVLLGAGPKLALVGACAVAALILSRRISPSAAALLLIVAVELAGLAWAALGGSGFGLIDDAFAQGCNPALPSGSGGCPPGEMHWGDGGSTPSGGTPAWLANTALVALVIGVVWIVSKVAGAFRAASRGGGSGPTVQSSESNALKATPQAKADGSQDFPEIPQSPPGQPDGTTPIVNPWTGKALTRWEPGRFGAGENGVEGQPGQVWWGGNWVDPADARQAIDEAVQADQKRAKASEEFHQQSLQLSQKQMKDRVTELEKEAEKDKLQRKRRDDVWNLVNQGNNLLAGVPDPARRGFLEDLMNKFAKPNGQGDYEGDPDSLQKAINYIRGQTAGASAQRTMDTFGEISSLAGDAVAIAEQTRTKAIQGLGMGAAAVVSPLTGAGALIQAGFGGAASASAGAGMEGIALGAALGGVSGFFPINTLRGTAFHAGLGGLHAWQQGEGAGGILWGAAQHVGMGWAFHGAAKLLTPTAKPPVDEVVTPGGPRPFVSPSMKPRLAPPERPPAPVPAPPDIEHIEEVIFNPLGQFPQRRLDVEYNAAVAARNQMTQATQRAQAATTQARQAIAAAKQDRDAAVQAATSGASPAEVTRLQQAARDAAQAARNARNDALTAQQELQNAQNQFRQARENWLHADPRRSARIAKENRQAIEREIQKLASRKQLVGGGRMGEELDRKMQQALAQRTDAIRAQEAAAARLRQHMEEESQAQLVIDRQIRRQFGLPEPKEEELPPGNLRVVQDTTELAQQNIEAKIRLRAEGRDYAPPTVRGTPGQRGFNAGPNSVSLPEIANAMHERMHALTSPTWKQEFRQPHGLNEGMTEFALTRYRNNHNLTQEPAWNRDSYMAQRMAVEDLAHAVGDPGLLERAYFHGEVSKLHAAVGRTAGFPPHTAEEGGRLVMTRLDQLLNNPSTRIQANEVTELLRQGNPDEALRVLMRAHP